MSESGGDPACWLDQFAGAGDDASERLRADAFAALDAASAGFRSRLVAVGADDWSNATPCAEWDVRALVNHVVGGNVRYWMLLEGAAPDAVNATRSVDHLRANAVASFDATAAQVTDAFHRPGALSVVVHHPAGDRTGWVLLLQRVVEFAVHAWDLARAIGADERLDERVVEFLWSHPEVAERGVAEGAYAAAPATSGTTSPQGNLLQRFGRSACG